MNRSAQYRMCLWHARGHQVRAPLRVILSLALSPERSRMGEEGQRRIWPVQTLRSAQGDSVGEEDFLGNSKFVVQRKEETKRIRCAEF